MSAAVVLPIRGFTSAKARLSAVLDAAERAQLARTLAERVVAAAGSLPIVVVTGAPEVRAWAAGLGLATLDEPGNLDAAADAGRTALRAAGHDRILVVHADLPDATTLAPLAIEDGRIAIVPCHRDDGTNVLSLPAGAPFHFSYGPGSFRRHAAEARRLGLGPRIVRDPALAFDVDVPEDLDRMTPTRDLPLPRIARRSG